MLPNGYQSLVAWRRWKERVIVSVIVEAYWMRRLRCICGRRGPDGEHDYSTAIVTVDESWSSEGSQSARGPGIFRIAVKCGVGRMIYNWGRVRKLI